MPHESPPGYLNLLVGFFLAGLVVMPFATMAHELGHAVLALRFSADPVTVQVGRPPAMVEIVGERLTIRWSLLPARGVPFAGLCLWNMRYATDLERMAVFLAGPLVTALLVPLFLWATIASLGSPHWLTATCWMSTISALVSLLLNVDPRTTDDEVSAGRIRRDGPRAPAPRSALGAGCSVTTPLILALQEPSAQPLLTMDSPSQLIDARIVELGDWRGETLARVRELVKEADPEVVEEWKWKGTPTWEHDGIICTGETYKKVVKMTFAKGASLEDPSGLFNSSLEGNVRRAIDVHEGEQIDEEAFKDLIRAAVALNTS